MQRLAPFLSVVYLCLMLEDRAGGRVDLVAVLHAAGLELDLIDERAVLVVQFDLHVIRFIFTHARVVQGDGLRGYSNFCVGFFFSTLISTERFLPTFVWDFSFYPQFRVSDFFQLLCGISSE